MNFKSIVVRYYDVIPYLFFGACTTGVNVLSFWGSNHLFQINVMTSTAIAWLLAVTFAYVTNRIWVFHSSTKTKKGIVREILAFYSCRIGTGLFDFACMFFFVVLLGLNGTVIKFLNDIVVIILNYIASKYLIFKVHDGV